MKTTGEKIRESRTHLGLTQTELADKIGVTLRTITKYEKQGVMPRGVNLQRLAEVLGVSTAYLSNDEIVDPNYEYGIGLRVLHQRQVVWHRAGEHS